MKRYTVTSTRNESRIRFPFWMPWGFAKWIGKLLLFVIALILFLLLFCIPKCSSEKEPNMPGLFNPDNPRGREEPTPLPDNGNNNPNWPINIGDDNRDPGLPTPIDNRIPPTDPGDVITDPRDGRQINDKYLIVILNSDATDETFNRFSSELSSLYSPNECSIAYYNTLSKTLLLEVKQSKRESIKNNLPNQITDIDFYIADMEIFGHATYQPNDKAFGYPEMVWYFAPIQAYEAWDITKGNPDVKVAVIDSYFELSHPDLKNVRVENPYSFENGTDNVYPPADADEASLVHGTHVAGTIFATMDNNEGSCGIAPDCTFIPISLGQSMNNFSMLEGILYAVYKGADVINLSLGLNVDESIAERLSIEDQIAIAENENIDLENLWDYVFKMCEERNVTIVWSAGNNNLLSAIDNSKRNNTTIKVDALDMNLRKAEFSNFGNVEEYGVEYSTISAPGCQIVNTVPFGDYYPLDGTSMAAPIVTGAVALMKSICPTLSNEEIIHILKETAKPVEDDNIGDLLQIRSALDMINGDLLRFDDVINNPESLIGKWKATQHLSVTNTTVDEVTGEKISKETGEEVDIYLTFNSTSHGKKEMLYVSGDRTGEICHSDVTVKFEENRIIIKDVNNPVSAEGSSFVKSIFYCVPDENGLLKVTNSQEGVDEDIYFNLKKIN